MARTLGLTPNLNAFLDAVALSELGAQILAESDDGYNVIVGSRPGAVHLFTDYTHHPGVLVALSAELSSTAAGRYQILKRYADVYIPQLCLPDFGPQSQDAIAIQMIDECHARPDVEAGYAADALIKCSSRWASLPASTYGQHTNRMSYLVAAYQAAGGAVQEA